MPGEVTAQDDLSLLERVKARDRAAFTTLMERHLPGLFRYASALAHGAPQAEDAVQEAFATLWRSAESFRGESSLRAWLRTITRNALARQLRKKADEPADTEPLDELAEHAGWGASDSVAARLEDRDLVRRVFDTLSPADRELLWLVEVDGLSLEEAAVATASSLAATKSRLHRARLRFLSAARLEGP